MVADFKLDLLFSFENPYLVLFIICDAAHQKEELCDRTFVKKYVKTGEQKKKDFQQVLHLKHQIAFISFKMNIIVLKLRNCSPEY